MRNGNHWAGFTIASGKAAWRTGAFLLKWGAKPAAKGSVWVIKKTAVDPAKQKITNWAMVEATLNAAHKVQAMKDAIRDGNCAQCGKKISTGLFGGPRDFCKPKCAQNAALQFNEVEQVKAGADSIENDDDNNLHLTCGCNRKNKFHGGGCTSNRKGERVAANVVWSNKNPNYQDPNKGPDHRVMSKREQQLEAVRERQKANPVPKSFWDFLG